MDSTAQIYVNFVHPPMLELAEWLKGAGRPVTVLDIGCGDGLKIGYLLDRGFFTARDRVIGLDVNPARIERVKQAYPILDGRIGDATTLEGIADDSCDGAIASAVIEHLEDTDLFLRNLRRVLRPGGRAYVSSLVRKRHIVYMYRNARGEFSRDPEHIYEWRSDAEFQGVMGRHLKVVKFRKSFFDVTVGCSALLLRRVGLLGDAAAARACAAMDRALPWLKVRDPFFHRVEVLVEKA